MPAKLQKLIIVLTLLVSLLPAAYINKWLQKAIGPRRSLVRLLLYILAAFSFVFVYTFLLIMLISKLFPLPKP